MNENIFKEEITKLNIAYNNEQINLLFKYYQFLTEYNEHTNLTTITEINDVYLKHFYDSLTLAKVINFNEYNNLLDIGSGAGFPGVIIKIFFPHLKVYLLDSNNKKTIFLNQLITKLNLQNIFVINERSEEYVSKNREKFDLVTARAVKELNILAELCLPFVRTGGYFLAMKGKVEKELTNGLYAINELGGKLESITQFYLSNNENERNIIKIKKNSSTKIIYPRNFSQIIKKPLKKIN